MAVKPQIVKRSRIERVCCACEKRIPVGSYYHFWEFGDEPRAKCRACGVPRLSECEPDPHLRQAYIAAEMLQDGILQAGDVFALNAVVMGVIACTPPRGPLVKWVTKLKELSWEEVSPARRRSEIIAILEEFPV